MIKLSHGLVLLLAPILAALGKIPVELAMAIHKASKRSLYKTKYPTDLRKVKLILEVHHRNGPAVGGGRGEWGHCRRRGKIAKAFPG